MATPADQTPLSILAIGAHPDDCDLGAGGLAALYARAGHRVHFVAATNGDAGHYAMGGAPLARRRRAEAQAAAAAIGIAYTVLDNHDGELEPSLANRRAIIRLIREARPDLILTHRPNDYHPDHRYSALLVQDAAYVVTVPGVVAFTPHLDANPVICYMHDRFRKPYPFEPAVVVDIDAVLEAKLDALHQHTSQVYEWLPYNAGYLEVVPAGEEERRAWLRETYAPRFAAVADQYRGALLETYGPEHGARVRHAEALEVSEYGAPLTPAARARLFPFLPTGTDTSGS
jgi:LmbE family N-acetylglucosaminyl deacetylase